MKLFVPATLLLSGLLLVGLSACHEKPVTVVQPVKKAQHLKEAKPGAAISLSSESITVINANEISSTELIFEVSEPSGTLMIELSPAGGLELLDTQTSQRIAFSSPGPIKVPVKLRALVDGRYYLNIHATLDNGDVISNRGLALIVQVGPEKARLNQLKKSSGDNVISLPAQETISN